MNEEELLVKMEKKLVEINHLLIGKHKVSPHKICKLYLTQADIMLDLFLKSSTIITASNSVEGI